MPAYRTPFNGYSVRFSPFVQTRLAVATSQVCFCPPGSARRAAPPAPPRRRAPHLRALGLAEGQCDQSAMSRGRDL